MNKKLNGLKNLKTTFEILPIVMAKTQRNARCN